jgi:peptide/nickel transport system permease protein
LIPYILKRVIGAVPILLLLTILEFGLLRILPGDPVEVLLGSSEKDLSQQELSVIRHDLGLDRSLPEQYVAWLKEVAKGNLGRSYRDGRPVSILIAERLPATVVLVGSALMISVVLGVFWGTAMTWLGSSRLVRWLDQLSASSALILYCIPSFWLAFLLIAWIGATNWPAILLLGLHPPGQRGICLASLILPASILASRRSAKLALLVRTSMLEEMDKEYVRTALAKGLSRAAILVRHVAKNSVGPIIAFLGLSVPALIGGSVLVEIVFAWPGMGRLAVDATFGRNYPVLLGLTLVYGAMVIASNLVADIIHRLIDPRIAAEDSFSGPATIGQTRA